MTWSCPTHAGGDAGCPRVDRASPCWDGVRCYGTNGTNSTSNIEPWQFDGPDLKLEFSRISASRGGALTLVIDIANGDPCRSAYTISRRADPDDAIVDLRCREGTVMRHMGFYFRDGSRRGLPDIPETIPPWAELHKFDVVVWTGLPSNFEKETGQPFSVSNAIKHLQTLNARGKASAAEYIWRAPELVDTRLRAALQSEPWFAADPKTSDRLCARRGRARGSFSDEGRRPAGVMARQRERDVILPDGTTHAGRRPARRADACYLCVALTRSAARLIQLNRLI